MKLQDKDLNQCEESKFLKNPCTDQGNGGNLWPSTIIDMPLSIPIYSDKNNSNDDDGRFADLNHGRIFSIKPKYDSFHEKFYDNKNSSNNCSMESVSDISDSSDNTVIGQPIKDDNKEFDDTNETWETISLGHESVTSDMSSDVFVIEYDNEDSNNDLIDGNDPASDSWEIISNEDHSLNLREALNLHYHCSNNSEEFVIV